MLAPRVLAFTPVVLAAALNIAPSPVTRPSAPPAPPDGTYVYAISRNGTDQGKTTITLTRRNEYGEIDVDESGYAGAAHASVHASYRYSDLVADSYVGVYRAPFLRSSSIGNALDSRARLAARGPVVVRYRIDGGEARASIDGVPAIRTWLAPAPSPKPPYRARTIVDAPFMAGAMLVPAYRRRSNDLALAPISEAFDEDLEAAPEDAVGTAPHDPKTPKTDVALEVQGFATIWFNRGNYIVDEAYFEGLNLDARLISYSRAAVDPSPDPEPTAQAHPHLQSRTLQIDAADGTKLIGVLDLPAGGKPRAPALIFVPPAPGESRNYDDEGPDPMYPSLALAFAARGYAIVRFDGRDLTSAAGSQSGTWESSISDVRDVIASTSGNDAIDPARMFLLGYGTGADLALAAAAGETGLAGVVALGPTVISYRECAKRSHAETASAFFKTSAAHDPGALAARAHLPEFVLEAGARCGETKDETTAYDDKLRGANARATIVVASDLSARFGGLYDADSRLDTQEFFPYRFDESTIAAIGDWLDNPKAVTHGSSLPPASGVRPPAPPAPPPVTDSALNGEMPNPHLSPTPEVEPGVVLPSDQTPPPVQFEATPTPAPATT